MNKRKLTKDEWYHAADYWSQLGNPSGPSILEWTAREEAFYALEPDEYGYHGSQEKENRWLMYAQYCLEKAGI